jgi:hypothetical protein
MRLGNPFQETERDFFVLDFDNYLYKLLKKYAQKDRGKYQKFIES